MTDTAFTRPRRRRHGLVVPWAVVLVLTMTVAALALYWVWHAGYDSGWNDAVATGQVPA